MNFQTFKHAFTGQCRGLDIYRDTFAGVLAKTGAEIPGGPPRLSRRDWNVLHGIYLKSLSAALSANTRPPRHLALMA